MDAKVMEATVMTQPGLVVVGVDGTAAGQAALTLAMREAWLRASTLLVLTTWQYDIYYDTVVLRLPLDVEQRARVIQEAAISAAQSIVGITPAICRRVIEGEAGFELVLAARGADLLVVGSSGKNAFGRAVLGSVSQFCLRHATCPVVVVPPERAAPERVELPQATKPGFIMEEQTAAAEGEPR